MAPIQVNIFRSSKVESSHLVDAVVLDRRGDRVAAFGAPETEVFTRSVIKPLQALPFLLSGAYETAPDPMKAISIACASHDAQPIHTEVVTAWLAKMGLTGENLICGPQRPADHSQPPGRIHHNCSGKHCGMIATCLQRGWDISTYHHWDHPLQKEIRANITSLSGYEMDSTVWGIDGCGLPTYSMPVESIARAMSPFLAPSKMASVELRSAMELAHRAWIKEPWMISGHGSLDSEILNATQGHVFVKVGAEGGYVALLFDQGLSIALKARDGAFRACEAALHLLLEKFANFDATTLDKIRAIALPSVKNANGMAVGKIEPHFLENAVNQVCMS